MALYHRDEYAEKYRRRPGCLLGLLWLCATVVGSAIGTPIADWILQGVADETAISLYLLASVALSGLAIGIFVGGAQALILMRYFKLRGTLEWILATTLGRVVRSVLILVLSFLLFGSDMGILPYAILMILVGMLAGLATGYTQRIVLELRVAQAHLWVWANVAASILTVTVGEFVVTLWALIFPNIFYYRNTTLFSLWLGIANGLIIGGITGYALMDLIRHPTSRAEWNIGWKAKQAAPPRFDPGVQPSPESMLDEMRKSEPHR